jgi:hypothetical protein
LVAAAGAHFGERLWIRQLVGRAAATGATAAGVGGGAGGDDGGFLVQRVRAFLVTWLRPGYTGPRQLTLALTVMVVAVGVGAFAARRHPGDRRTIVVACSVAVTAALVAVVTKPTNIVPGLLVAFPLLFAGLLLIRRDQLRTTAARAGLATFAVFAFGVLATQYANGGSGEWGGRYFALGLPVVIPVLLLALRDAGVALAPVTRRWAVASLATVTVVMAVMGVASLSHGHRFTADLVANIERAGHEVSPLRPIMVTTSPAIPRLAWSTFDDQRWLLTSTADLPTVRAQLAAAGVDRFVFVTTSLDRDAPALAGLEVVSRQGLADRTGHQILVLRSHA